MGNKNMPQQVPAAALIYIQLSFAGVFNYGLHFKPILTAATDLKSLVMQRSVNTWRYGKLHEKEKNKIKRKKRLP